jgi:hypothetical protein
MNTDNTLAIISPSNALSTRTYKNSETRTYGGALKFKAYCESEGLTNDNSTHEERVKAHSAHCNDVNGNGRLLVTRMEDKNGLVFDKVSVNTDKDGVKRMSVSYVRKVVPKEKLSKKLKLANRVSSASAEIQARIEAIIAEEEAKTIDIAS